MLCCAGTGKTKTILGLLSIILHSAPKGAYSSDTAPQAAPGQALADGLDFGRSLTLEQRHELWLKSSPWLSGRQDSRWAATMMLCSCSCAALGAA
jgi:hypothetical protein